MRDIYMKHVVKMKASLSKIVVFWHFPCIDHVIILKNMSLSLLIIHLSILGNSVAITSRLFLKSYFIIYFQ